MTIQECYNIKNMSTTTTDKIIADLLGAARVYGKRAEAASGLDEHDLDAVGYGPDVEGPTIARIRAFLEPTHPRSQVEERCKS